MSTESLTNLSKDKANQTPKCHALHVKEVPYDVWCRARHNANLSRMTLRQYVIKILAEAPALPEAVNPSGEEATLIAIPISPVNQG
jgi:hypothetical protein